MLKFKITFFILLLFTSFSSCNNSYKAGNLVALSYPVETSLRTEIVKRYIDTLIRKNGFGVPKKWVHFNKLVDLDSINHQRIYFKNNPEEMYLISYGGMLILNDVYNPKLNQYDWIAVREDLSTSEELRIKSRFEGLLKEIERMAKRDNLSDSTIYQ